MATLLFVIFRAECLCNSQSSHFYFQLYKWKWGTRIDFTFVTRFMLTQSIASLQLASWIKLKRCNLILRLA